MGSNGEHFAFGWRDYKTNFSIAFNDLLREEDLVDVTVVADGHLFNAHRLILSALSPYFRKMFKQMPTNQQAFVFLKDVSKQTAEHLLTYIYNGEVNVASECLTDFMNVAKSLDIKGMNDVNCSQLLHSSSASQTWPNPAFNGIQYQSTHINQHFDSTVLLKETNPVHVQSTESNYFQPSMDEYGGDENFDYGNSSDAYEMETSSDQKHEYVTNGGYSMNQDDDKFDQWSGEYENDSQNFQNTNKVKAPIAQRRKRNDVLSDYNVCADIRLNKNGHQNLFYNGFKHCRDGSGKIKTRWACTCNKSKKCKGVVSTVEIDGVTMMKIVNGEHTHEPQE